MPWTIYIKNFGAVHCASKEDAKKITAEYLKRLPNAVIHDHGPLHLATAEAFFNEDLKGLLS